MIDKAPELINISDLLNAAGLTGVFLFFMIPSIVIIITAYGLYRYIKNRKFKKVKQIEDKGIGDKVKLEPDDKSKFSSLTLDFDEKGRVK